MIIIVITTLVVVLKNNIFTFMEKTLKQKRGTAIGTKFAPPYSILFMAELEEEILSEIELKPYLWWRYIDDIFFLWEHGDEKLKRFMEYLNENGLKHRSTSWMFQFHLQMEKLLQIYMLKLQIAINISTLPHVTHIIAKTEFHTAKLFV